MGLYVDDTAISYQNRQPALVMNQLQMNAKKRTGWFVKWKITGKSKALLIQRRRKYLPEQQTDIVYHGRRK